LFLRGADNQQRLVVPDSMMLKFMFAVHQGAAHKKRETMLAIFEKHFFNPNASRFADQVLAECIRCQQVDPRRIDRSHGTDPTAWARFECLFFDVFEVRNAGPYRYGLLCIDINTGVFEVTPMMQQTAVAIEKALRNGYLSRWPHPRFWQSDNANAMIGTVLKQLETELNISRLPKAQRNPRGNGAVERAIGLFKDALRKVTPIGADWTQYAQQVQYGLLCAVSKTRGGYSPMELATGVAPVVAGELSGQAAPQQIPAIGNPTLSIKQRFAAQQKALKSQVAATSSEANSVRLARNAGVQVKQQQAGLVTPVWQVGDVVWIDDKPFKKAGKWDQKFRRSRPLVITHWDEQSRRVRVVDFESRLQLKGWFPTHLLSKVKGGPKVLAELASLRVELGQLKPTDVATNEEGPEDGSSADTQQSGAVGAVKSDESVSGQVKKVPKQKKAPKKKQTQGASGDHQPQEGLQVPCDEGIIVNVTRMTGGTMVLLAEPVAGTTQADWSMPLIEVSDKLLPAAIVHKAWTEKHLLNAPPGVRKSARQRAATTKPGYYDREEVLYTQQSKKAKKKSQE
jgi:hypothetical protein